MGSLLLLQLCMPLMVSIALILVKSRSIGGNQKNLVEMVLPAATYHTVKTENPKEIKVGDFLYDLVRVNESGDQIHIIAEKDHLDTRLTHWSDQEVKRKKQEQRQHFPVFAFLFYEHLATENRCRPGLILPPEEYRIICDQLNHSCIFIPPEKAPGSNTVFA